jgi:mannose-6-phosphate isomerase-like protein (cupin superfamily)
MRFTLLMISLAAAPVALLSHDDASVRIIPHDLVAAAFATGSPLVEGDDYKVHASRREAPGVAEIHTRDTDIAYVVQGSATLVTGGAAVDLKPTAPEELRGTAITGGEARKLVPGDVAVIPNGVPHWFKEVEPPFLYYVVKVRQAERSATRGGQ